MKKRSIEEEENAAGLVFDPRYPTKYDRSARELELFMLFCVMVANKPAMATAEKLTSMFGHIRKQPFRHLRDLGPMGVRTLLKSHRTGQYTRISGAIAGVLELNLRQCTLEELLAIPGIGNKTARFYLLHSRHDVEYAVIDTHILKYLREKGYVVPRHTPSGNKQYEILESVWLNEVKRDFPLLTVAEADLAIWRKYSGN